MREWSLLSKLPLVWTKHIKEPEKREDFEKLLRNSTTVLSRLQDILQEKEASLTSAEQSPETYRAAGYPYLQAHMNGRRAELREIQALLNFIGNK
jgi:hypothetical protein